MYNQVHGPGTHGLIPACARAIPPLFIILDAAICWVKGDGAPTNVVAVNTAAACVRDT